MTDTPRPGEHSSAPSPQARPSLTGQQSSSESVSILSAVTPPRRAEASPVPKGVSSALPWIGVLALIVIGVIFWIELSGGRTPAAAPDVAAVAPATPAMAPAPAAAPDPAPAEVATIENEHPVATIEATPPPAHATAPPSPAATPGMAAAAAASSAPRETKPSAVAPVGKSAVASVESASGQRSPFAAMDTPAPARKAKPATPAAPAAPTGNSDVDLLQALLSVTPQQNRGTAAAPAPRAAPKAVPKPAPVPVVKETSRDVVERDPVISTGDLLKRCDKLGVLEAVLCKTRICSGLWGRDSACPVTNDPAYKKG